MNSHCFPTFCFCKKRIDFFIQIQYNNLIRACIVKIYANMKFSKDGAMTTGIYSLIDKKRLHSVLQTLSRCTGLHVRLIDADGGTLCAFGTGAAYCRELNEKVFPEKTCVKLHADAGRQAQKLGEAYIFTCQAELSHIAFPLLHREELLGTIIAGPFLMDAPDATFLTPLAERYPISTPLACFLYDALRELPVFPPAKVNDLKALIDHLFSPLMPAERMLLLQTQQKVYQQARVSEAIHVYKDEPTEETGGAAYFGKQAELLERVRSDDCDAAVESLGKLMGHVLYTEGFDPDNLRLHAQALLSLFVTAAVDGGASGDLVYKLSRQYLARLYRSKTVEEICFFLQEALENLMAEMLTGTDNGNPYIRAALSYMTKNYSKPLTLESVAAEVSLSPNYFSSLFRRTVGVTFREQLNRIRVEESKRLLLSTDYSLIDIAIAMGFNDQGYYCKVFKRVTGLTPGSYRAKQDRTLTAGA